MLSRETCTAFIRELTIATTVEQQNAAWLILKDYLIEKFNNNSFPGVFVITKIPESGVITTKAENGAAIRRQYSSTSFHIEWIFMEEGTEFIIPEHNLVFTLKLDSTLIGNADPYEYVNEALNKTIDEWTSCFNKYLKSVFVLTAEYQNHFYRKTILHKLGLRNMCNSIYKNDSNIDMYVMSRKAFSNLFWLCKTKEVSSWIDIHNIKFMSRKVLLVDQFDDNIIYGVPKNTGTLFIRIDTCLNSEYKYAINWVRQIGTCVDNINRIYAYEIA